MTPHWWTEVAALPGGTRHRSSWSPASGTPSPDQAGEEPQTEGLLGMRLLVIVLGAPILLVRSLLEIPALSTSLCAASTSTSSYQEVTEEGTIQDK